MNRYTALLCSALALGAAAPCAFAGPLPGARETFTTETNADAWTVYDYSDDGLYYGNHEESDGGWLSFPYTGDFAFQVYADGTVADGAFTGDYAAAGIRSVAVEALVPVLEEFDQLDCVLYCDGPAGLREYYSAVVLQEDLVGGSGWYELVFDFRDVWFYYDEDEGGYVAFAPGPAFPADVREVGFRFFPVPGINATSFGGIDNVTLLPDVVAPDVAAAAAGGGITLSFTPPPGLKCDVEVLDAAGAAWSPVAGHTGITGPAQHAFPVPVAGKRAFYRVRAEAVITDVVTP